MSLKNDQIDRYRAQINLKRINIQGQIKIQNTSVLIIGIGGIGTPVLQCLARAGISKFGIVDYDKISKSNLHRQILFDQKDIGLSKVQVAKRKILAIDKKIKIQTYKLKIGKSNINSLLKKYDYIVDGTDNFKTKLLINDASVKLKKKLFIGAVGQLNAHIFFFNFEKESSCFKCFMPKAPSQTPRCQDEGILGTVTNITGTIIVNEMIKDITNLKSSIVNRLLVIDLENLSFRNVKVSKSKVCKNHG